MSEYTYCDCGFGWDAKQSSGEHTCGMYDEPIEKTWDEFWKEICCPSGVLDLNQVKKELYDFHYMIEQVPKVYTEITGGRLSKPNYSSDTVISEFHDVQEEQFKDYLKDETEELEEELSKWKSLAGELVGALKTVPKDYFNVDELTMIEKAERELGK